jgi:HSP20 family molecular chaperone IbpA
MATTIDKSQGLQTRETRDVATTTEATRPGVLLTPPVDIFEDSEAITVVADMPGVDAGHLTIDLHEGVLTITGHAAVPGSDNEVAVLHEYPAGATFQRSFTLSEAIDQDRIQATLKNGVLRLRLPKAERAKPRQIAIQTG